VTVAVVTREVPPIFSAREGSQPPPSDLLVGPEGDHIGPVAENDVELVRHHRERRDLDAEEPGQRLQAVPNPGSAMIVGVARERGSTPQRKALCTTR
jgi:hypothetical protein